MFLKSFWRARRRIRLGGCGRDIRPWLVGGCGWRRWRPIDLGRDDAVPTERGERVVTP